PGHVRQGHVLVGAGGDTRPVLRQRAEFGAGGGTGPGGRTRRAGGTAAPGLTQAQLAAQLPRGPGGPGAIKYPERGSPGHGSARARPGARVRRRKLMAAWAASRGAIPPLARIEPRLLGTAARRRAARRAGDVLRDGRL